MINTIIIHNNDDDDDDDDETINQFCKKFKRINHWNTSGVKRSSVQPQEMCTMRFVATFYERTNTTTCSAVRD